MVNYEIYITFASNINFIRNERKLLSILALLCLTITSAWADWNGETYTATANETINGPINVSTAILTIDEGVTVTVNNGIVISGILTIKGSGTLKVYGSGGSGIVGNGDGNGGGSAFKGTVNIYSGNVTARGGNGAGGAGGANHYSDENGADGGDGGQGGEGGAAFEGTVIIYGGTVTATGGNGGEGGWGG